MDIVLSILSATFHQCLTCSPSVQVACGRYINQHMVAHNSKTGHPLVLSFEDLSVWCYECQAYVHHSVSYVSSAPLLLPRDLPFNLEIWNQYKKIT